MVLQRKTELKRKQPRRIWSEALDKLQDEQRCRVCRAAPGTIIDGSPVVLECAHTVGREHDPVEAGPRGGEVRVVKREATVPLCRDDHRAFDEHRLDLLPYLSRREEVYAAECVGLARAYKRLSGPDG